MKIKAESSDGQINLLDPSDYRPDHKDMQDFRNYKDSTFFDRVRKTYYEMHTGQCVEFVKQREAHWLNFDHAYMPVMEALKTLNDLVDASDPDLDLPNSLHAFQTAELIREAHPDKEWFHLVGLIHDLGKLMAIHGEAQWSTVGDTFPVGCAFSDKIVFGLDSFAKNPDINHPVYSTKLGMYKEHCGLANVNMSWGHDEFMYRVLKNHGSTLPEEAMYMVRYHSFYPWHTGKEYMHLCDEKDLQMMDWIIEFNQYDLYSKSDQLPDVSQMTPYYQSLVDKYIPGMVHF